MQDNFLFNFGLVWYDMIRYGMTWYGITFLEDT